MSSNVSDFFLALMENPELLEKFKGKSLDDCYKIATKDEKWSFTKKEFLIILKKLIEQENLVDDENLNNVSGGVNLDFLGIGTAIKRLGSNIADDYTTIFKKEKTANQYLELFGDTAKLFGDVGYLYGAIAKFNSKLEEEEAKDFKRKQETLKKIISEEKAKKQNQIKFKK